MFLLHRTFSRLDFKESECGANFCSKEVLRKICWRLPFPKRILKEDRTGNFAQFDINEFAGVAQLVEQRIRNAQVTSSTLVASSSYFPSSKFLLKGRKIEDPRKFN